MKNSFWKMIALMLCLLVMAGALAGCGSSDEDTSASTTTSSVSKPDKDNASDPGDNADLVIGDCTWYSADEDVYYHFFDDGTLLVEITAGSEFALGAYDWDGREGSFIVADVEADIKAEDDGLYLTSDDTTYQIEFVSVVSDVFGGTVAGTAWELDGITFNFEEDAVVAYGDGSVYFSSFEWDNKNGTGSIDYDDETLNFLLYDGILLAGGDDGYYAAMEEAEYEEMTSEYGSGAEADLYGWWLWSEDGVSSLVFDGAGKVTVGEHGEEYQDEYTYTFDGENVAIYDDGGEASITGYIDSDGDLILNDFDGYFEMQSEENQDVDDGNWSLVEDSDGIVTYTDYDRNISFKCPSWMTIVTGGIGESTDAVIVGDDAYGFVIGDNVTNEWNDYSGSNSEFMQEYLETCMPEFFTPIYGMWEDSTYEEVDSDESNRLATFDMNLWNDDFDIRVISLLYYTDKDEIIVKTFMAPYGEDDQLQYLWDNVRSMTGLK